MRRLFIVATLLFVSACGGGSPSAPSTATPATTPPTTPAAPSAFAGIWDLTYRIDGCAASRFWYCPDGGVQPMTLRIDESGGVSALAVSRSVMVPLSGSAREVGELLLAGERVAQSGTFESTQRIRDMRLRADNGTLTGTFALTTAAPTLFTELTATIQSVESHRPLESDQRFEGSWQGTYKVQACAVTRGSACGPYSIGHVETVALTLVDVGPSVQGVLELDGHAWIVPVTGTVQGNRITLEGVAEKRTTSVSRLTVRGSDLRRDRLGILSGTIEYDWDYFFGERHDASSARIDMRYVAKRP